MLIRKSIGDRMKAYENAYRSYLTPRMPVIVRVDGKAFHGLLRNARKPFDMHVTEIMDEVSGVLVREIQNARMAYTQSDEVSVLLVDYNRFDSEQWFDGNIQKIVSVAASLASVTFSSAYKRPALFDARAFVIPERDVCNYFVWRQQDAVRNSVSMAVRAYYSHAEAYGKTAHEQHEMLYTKGVNWRDYPVRVRRGGVFVAGKGMDDPPTFTSEPEYLRQFLLVEEE